MIITDDTQQTVSNLIDTTSQEQQASERERQTRIKHRTIKGQTYHFKLFNRSSIE